MRTATRLLRGAAVATAALVVGALVQLPATAAVTPPRVTEAVTVVDQPQNQSVVAGTDATFSARATDGTDATLPVDRWEVQVSGSATWTSLGAAGQATLTVTNVTPDLDQARYRAVWLDGTTEVPSSSALLRVWTLPVVTTAPTSLTLDAGAAFTLTAAATGNPAPTVQWESGATLSGPWTDVPGATTTSMTGTAPPGGTSDYYRATFANTAGSTSTPVATVTAKKPSVVVTDQPDSVTVLAGATASFTAAAKAGRDVVPVLRWEVQLDGTATWQTVGGSAGRGTLTVTASVALDQAQYRAVWDDGGALVTSRAAVLTVRAVPSVTTQPASQTVLAGAPFTLTAAATGRPVPAVQWQRAASRSGPWSPVAGATATTFTGTAPAGGTSAYYRAVFTNVVGTATSDPATITGRFPDPTPVASVTVTNPTSGQLVVGWPASTGGPVAGYRVTVYDRAGSVATRDLAATVTSTAFTVPAGTYTVGVAPRGANGLVTETRSASITVQGTLVTGTVSAPVIRPYVDRYQDTVVLRASSNFPTTGSIVVVKPNGAPTRVFPLRTGTSWSVVFNGRSASGAQLVPGRYTVRFVIAGTALNRSLVVASSQVGWPTRSWSTTPFYPVVDRYKDTSTLTVRTDVPATTTIRIKGANGRVYLTRSYSPRTATSMVWNGRSGSRYVPAGRYLATVTVKGGEGVARTVGLYVYVSLAKRTAVGFTVRVTATGALERMATGSLATGTTAGSQVLRGCPGCDAGDLGLYRATLPTSVSGYAGVRVRTCVSVVRLTPQGVFAYSDGNTVLGGGWAVAYSGAGCYQPGTAPAGAVTGRTAHWVVGNRDTQTASAFQVSYFELVGTRYVLR